MFCWQARLRFSELPELPDTPETTDLVRGPRAAPGRLSRHLQACRSCRQELEDLRRVSALVAESARTLTPPVSTLSGDAFVDQVVRAGRARKASVEHPALPISFLPRPPRPLPLAAALVLMIGAVALAHIAGGSQAGAPVSRASTQATQSAATAAAKDADALDDGVMPPREIPFVVQRDLVGARRGSIPLTTYVLEPAPDVKPVMRASL